MKNLVFKTLKLLTAISNKATKKRSTFILVIFNTLINAKGMINISELAAPNAPQDKPPNFNPK